MVKVTYYLRVSSNNQSIILVRRLLPYIVPGIRYLVSDEQQVLIPVSTLLHKSQSFPDSSRYQPPSRRTCALRCIVLRQADVLVDKAPLRRGSSTPACLMELARVRSDTRTDGGAGVCRLGVVGPAVDRLVNLLLVSYEYVACLASMSGLRHHTSILFYQVYRSLQVLQIPEHLRKISKVMDLSCSCCENNFFFPLFVSQISRCAVVHACPCRCAYICETGRYRRAPCPHYILYLVVYDWYTANLLGNFECNCILLQQC